MTTKAELASLLRMRKALFAAPDTVRLADLLTLNRRIAKLRGKLTSGKHRAPRRPSRAVNETAHFS